MAVYRGRESLRVLKTKLKRQSEELLQKSVERVVEVLVDNSPVGADEYLSKLGPVPNEAGDFKNGWAVGVNSPSSATRGADESGSGAIAAAMAESRNVTLKSKVYITNNVHYAGNVEHGWDANLLYGWKAKEGYHVVENTKDQLRAILTTTAIEVLNT